MQLTECVRARHSHIHDFNPFFFFTEGFQFSDCSNVAIQEEATPVESEASLDPLAPGPSDAEKETTEVPVLITELGMHLARCVRARHSHIHEFNSFFIFTEGKRFRFSEGANVALKEEAARGATVDDIAAKLGNHPSIQRAGRKRLAAKLRNETEKMKRLKKDD